MRYKLLRYADFFRFSLTSFEYPEKNISVVKDHSLRSSINYLQLVDAFFAKFSFVQNLQTKVLIFPAKNGRKTGVSTFVWPVVAGWKAESKKNQLEKFFVLTKASARYQNYGD